MRTGLLTKSSTTAGVPGYGSSPLARGWLPHEPLRAATRATAGGRTDHCACCCCCWAWRCCKPLPPSHTNHCRPPLRRIPSCRGRPHQRSWHAWTPRQITTSVDRHCVPTPRRGAFLLATEQFCRGIRYYFLSLLKAVVFAGAGVPGVGNAVNVACHYSCRGVLAGLRVHDGALGHCLLPGQEEAWPARLEHTQRTLLMKPDSVSVIQGIRRSPDAYSHNATSQLEARIDMHYAAL